MSRQAEMSLSTTVTTTDHKLCNKKLEVGEDLVETDSGTNGQPAEVC